MRFFILPLAIFLIFSSCSSSKKTNATAGSTTSSISTRSSGEADGSSFEKAIVIDEKSETKGVNAEYAWLKKNYPGYSFKSQSLNHKGKVPYDIITIKTADGETKNIYFDISRFFGKF